MYKVYLFIVAVCINLATTLHAQNTEIVNQINSIIQVVQPATAMINTATESINKTIASENIEDFRVLYKDMISAIDDAKKIYKRNDELFKPIDATINATSCEEAVDSYIRSKDLMIQAFNQCRQIIMTADKILAEETVVIMKTKNDGILADIADLKEKQLLCITNLNAIIEELKKCE